MISTILLPLDGSMLAERALPYAAAIARQSNARAVLVQAAEAHPFLGVDLTDAQVAAVNDIEAYLHKAANRLTSGGVATQTHLAYDEPVHSILDAVDREGADLIVMSTHGRSGLGRMLYGSVTDKVLRRATVPVLIVPSIVDHPWSAARQLSLLVPLDGSALAEEALDAAAMLVAPGQTQLMLLRVVEPPTYPIYGDGYAFVPFDEDAEIAAARTYLEEQTARLRERGWQVQSRVTVGYAAGAIAAVAREQSADLIVMATHGHGGLSRLLLGSVATSTLRQTTVPLLLTRPAALAHATGEPSTTDEQHPESTPRMIDVHLDPLDLELITHGLRALAYAPGYEYGQIVAARALANRLEATAQADVGEPIASR